MTITFRLRRHNTILDNQFTETYTIGLNETPKSNRIHNKNRTLRELSQFNSSIFSYFQGKFYNSKSTMDTQRLNVDYKANPLNSIYGTLIELCIHQKCSKTKGLNNILSNNFQYAIHQNFYK